MEASEVLSHICVKLTEIEEQRNKKIEMNKEHGTNSQKREGGGCIKNIVDIDDIKNRKADSNHYWVNKIWDGSQLTLLE